MPDPTATTVTPAPKLDKYDGVCKDIRVQTWLRLFEVHTSEENDTARIKSLMYNLKGIALEWYGDEIAANTSIKQWSTVKDKMTKRFGLETSTPLIDAQRRKLKRDETVEDYFREKMRLLRQTKLKDEDIVLQLTEGLPFSWKLSMTSARPSDTHTWFELAQQIETHFKQQDRFNKDRNRTQRNTRTLHANNNNSNANYNRNRSQPPRTPCRICQRLNRTEYHWHRECPNKANQPERRAPPTATEAVTAHAAAVDTVNLN